MITPSTKLVNLLEKAQGWKVHSCSNEQMIELVKTAFLEGASSEQIEQLKKSSKGSFLGQERLMSANQEYELVIQGAAYSTGRRICIYDHKRNDMYQRDYLLVKKFADAVRAECIKAESELSNRNEINKESQENNDTKNKRDYCIKCGAEINKDDKFCTTCGFPIPCNVLCPQCHAELSPEAKFCPMCGIEIKQEDSVNLN